MVTKVQYLPANGVLTDLETRLRLHDSQISEALTSGISNLKAENQTATASQTVFTLVNGTYTPGNASLVVYMNGLKLRLGSDYSETSPSAVTLVTGALAGDELDFIMGASVAASINSSMVGYTPAGTGAVATDVESKLREAPSPEDQGCIGDGVTIDTTNLQLAINAANGKKLYLANDYLVDAGLDFTGWSGMIYGPGKIICKATTSIPYVLYFLNASNVIWNGVSLDMGQTSGTLTGGLRADSGFYLKDARDCFFNYVSITNCKFGEPIYVDGTSSVSPSASHGSKHIYFNGVNCVAISAATVDDGAFINVRSDFYTATGGGLYLAASNGCKESDYTLDAAVAYQRTTENIFFTNCNFENLDRFALYNSKGVHLSNVSMVNNYTRGLTMSPSCENVTWTGGKVSGNAAHINANYACKDVVISNLVALGETASIGSRHTLRTGYGSERIKFSNISGLGNDARHVFIEGARDVTFENVSLNQWSGGNTTASVSVAGGASGNTSSWVTDRIKFIGCDLSANYAFKFDDNAGTATVADGAVVCDETCRFNIGISFYNGAAPVKKLLYHGSGTFTPTLAGGSVAGSQTYSYTPQGRYRRKGDLVFVEMSVQLTTKDAATSGSLRIAGLPFVSSNLANNNGALTFGYWNGLTFPANFVQPGLFIAPNTSFAALYRFGSGQTAGLVQASEAGNTFGAVVSGSYIAES